MVNTHSKVTMAIITDDTLSKNVRLRLMKRTINLLKTDDTFLSELNLVQEMLPIMKQAEQYCLEHPEFRTLESECGKFMIEHKADNYIKFYMLHHWNDGTVKLSLHCTATINYQEIPRGNFINEDWFSYSPLNKGMTVLREERYILNDDLEHDEALYFQKMTQYNLPLEEYYISTQEVLKSLWDSNYVHLDILLYLMLEESYIKEYEKLVQRMEIL